MHFLVNIEDRLFTECYQMTFGAALNIQMVPKSNKGAVSLLP